MTANRRKLLDISKEFNKFLYKDRDVDYVAFTCEGSQIGLLTSEIKRDLLSNYPQIFKFEESLNSVELDAEKFHSFDTRSDALEKVLLDMRRRYVKYSRCALSGWRDECYDIRAEGYEPTSFGDTSPPPLFKIERSATPLFGLHQYGVDINGYVRDDENGKDLKIWLQKRSDEKPTWPGFWDNFVGGGLTSDHSIMECVLKEAYEEAGLKSDQHLNVTEGLIPTGCVTLCYESERGICLQTEYTFDLQLPSSFNPSNTDGEVQSFDLIHQDKILDLVCSDKFKMTSRPIILDFLIRKGVINIKNEPNLAQLVENLHPNIHSIYDRSRKVRC